MEGVKKTKNRFWNIKNVADKVALYIYGEIAGDQWDKWTDDDKCPADFITALADAKGKDIDLYINSPGGSVFGGLAIYHQLKRYSGKVTVHVDGLAASIASVIMLAGSEVIVPENAMVMIHNPINFMYGYYGASDMREMADTLDRISNVIANVYLGQSGKTEDEIKTAMENETWFSGKDAAEFFNVKVSAPIQAAALAHGCTNFKNAPDAVKAIPQVTDELKEQLSDLALEAEIWKED